MNDLLVGLGLLLVLEGVLYGGLPHLAKRLAAEVLAMPEQALRSVGIASIVIGVGVVWLVRG